MLGMQNFGDLRLNFPVVGCALLHCWNLLCNAGHLQRRDYSNENCPTTQTVCDWDISSHAEHDCVSGRLRGLVDKLGRSARLPLVAWIYVYACDARNPVHGSPTLACGSI
mmetsp:Transcript_66411/g.117438  ORF Transcript_66411/g.117438 Transcript_66411/m.117438 type:complete len:110 (+) Transcript_66411:497-826(+)